MERGRENGEKVWGGRKERGENGVGWRHVTREGREGVDWGQRVGWRQNEMKGDGFWDSWELERRTGQKESRGENKKEEEQEAGRAGARESRRQGEQEAGRAGARESRRQGEQEAGRAGAGRAGRAGGREVHDNPPCSSKHPAHCI